MIRASEEYQKQGFTLCPHYLTKIQGEYLKGREMPCQAPSIKMIETVLLSAEKVKGDE
jgi:hypothetical protein